MRFFTVFFALYLLVLACLPCADVAAGPVVPARAHVAAQTDAASHHQKDWCTPLCQCQCCSGTSLPMVTGVALTAKTPAAVAAVRFARLTPPNPLQRAGSIWQPPQA